MSILTKQRRLAVIVPVLLGALLFMSAFPVQAQDTAFRQSVAEASYGNEAVGAFYRTRDYQPIFTGAGDGPRRAALLRALQTADLHGLPAGRYDPEELKAAFRAAKSPRALGRAEVLAAKMFVQYAQDIQSGAMTPSKIDRSIVRDLPRRDQVEQLRAFATASPAGYLKSLPPKTPQYTALLAEKMRLQHTLEKGGWGARVPGSALKPGQSGDAVVALRNRLIAMGYLGRSASQHYDGNMQKAVQQFQLAHGLTPDGVAGEGTIKALNVPARERLASVLVAMERERWTNIPKGERHILVNIPEFTARIIDDGKVSFATRVVVGKNKDGQRTPEFSDVMEYMVINPTWNVPRSIATKEYLPQLKRNPNAVSHLKLVDSRGRTISRSAVNFAQYSASTFPFALKQPPSQRNALGQVKFMFPNKYNIYLHDTPSKSLFARDRRDFSHGCVRVADPKDLAYALLALQSDDPEGLFNTRLRTGAETRVNLDATVPVHIQYRTAFATPKGRMNYREDVYGRDAKIWAEMQKAGVSLELPGS
ncbi:L,D-transpeptidase family protein [Aliiruegeria lutimaris]|uniref:Murein L,D-transpeptidase YcbB/YkuD n=1 Tax=Aliiruegeria lutimaris TaxID=571298 RepID=A0A1G8KWM7_9RHOB|nr:L,D-transpeptidase family protein [Aliiruegeria lutimaris]SDI47792.1 Murein L,D-transpeptidase YcbB/YkuD [Aliiruegeria lutimaris]